MHLALLGRPFDPREPAAVERNVLQPAHGAPCHEAHLALVLKAGRGGAAVEERDLHEEHLLHLGLGAYLRLVPLRHLGRFLLHLLKCVLVLRLELHRHPRDQVLPLHRRGTAERAQLLFGLCHPEA